MSMKGEGQEIKTELLRVAPIKTWTKNVNEQTI